MVQDNNIDLAAAIAFYNTEIVVACDIAFCNNILLFTQDEFFFFLWTVCFLLKYNSRVAKASLKQACKIVNGEYFCSSYRE